jgi:hypothetical protein
MASFFFSRQGQKRGLEVLQEIAVEFVVNCTFQEIHFENFAPFVVRNHFSFASNEM